MTSQPPSELRPHREKEEEKEEEKRHEKGPEEKNWDEKWRRDPLGSLIWALILIWAGVALLLSNMGLLFRIPGLEVWELIFLGAGVLILAEVGSAAARSDLSPAGGRQPGPRHHLHRHRAAGVL